MKQNTVFSWVQQRPIVLLLVGFVLFFTIASDSFLTFSNLTNILIQSSSLTILAVGMTFVLLTAGIDLSVGSVLFVVAILAGQLALSGWALIWIFPIVLLIGAAFGWLNGIFVVRLKIVPFIVTLATLYIGRGLGLQLSDTRAINLPDSFLTIGTFRLFGIPLPIIIMLLIVLAAHLTLTKTSFGRQLYAIGNDQTKAKKAGIPVQRHVLLVYIVCSLCAAIGGMVAVAQLGAVSPTFGNQTEFMAIAAAVLGGVSLFGGKGTIFPGTFLGAIMIQSIQNGLVLINADPYVYPLVTGTLIFLIVLADSRRHFSR